MNKAFWQSLIANEYAILTDSSVQALTSEILPYLASVDPEIREGPAYAILGAWIYRKSSFHTELWKMATQFLYKGHEIIDAERMRKLAMVSEDW